MFVAFGLALIFLLGITGTSILIKRNFCWVTPFYILASGLSLYLFTAIFRNVRLAIVITCILSVVILVYSIVKLKKEFIDRIKEYCIIGLIVYLCLSVAIIALAYIHGPHLKQFDEYMFWMPMIKNIVAGNDFYINADNMNNFHCEYAPIVQLFESAPSVLRGQINYMSCFYMSYLLQFSLFVPFFSLFKQKLTIKTVFRVLCLAVLIFCGITLFIVGLNYGFFVSLLQDCILGLLAGFALFVCLGSLNNKYFYIKNGIVLAFLVLVKEYAIIFCGIVFLVILIRLILHRKTFSKKDAKRNVISCIIIIIIPAIAIVSWKLIYGASFAAANDFPQHAISIAVVIDTINTLPPGYLTNIFNRFVGILFSEGYWCFKIIICDVFVFAVVIIFSIFIWKKKYLNNDYDKFTLIVNLLAISLFVGFFAFNFMFIFYGTDRFELVSCQRYLDSLIVCLIVFNAYVWFLVVKTNNKRHYLALYISCGILALLCIVTFFETGANWICREPASANVAKNEYVPVVKEKCENNTSVVVIDDRPYNENIFVANLEDEQHNYNMIFDSLAAKGKNLPVDVRYKYDQAVHEMLSKDDYYKYAQVANEEINQILMSMDYIYCNKLNNVQKDLLSRYNGFTAEENCMYKIIKDNGTISFQKI